MKKRSLLSKMFVPGAIAIVGALAVNDLARNPIKAYNKLITDEQVVEDNLENITELPEVAELARTSETIEIPDVVYDDYKENPQNYDFGEGSDTLELTRLLVGEAEKYWDWKNDSKSRKYLELVAGSVLTRQNDFNTDLKSIIYEIHKNKKARKGYAFEYSCFNDFSDNHGKVIDPLNNGVKQEVWDSLYEFAEKAIAEGPKYDLDHYTKVNQFWEDPAKLIAEIEGTRFYDLNDRTMIGDSLFGV